MKFKKLVTVLCSLFFITSAFFFVEQVEAAGGLRFSVKPNIPDNQHNKEVTYYDLMMSPGQSQEITVTLRNTSDSDVTVVPKINSAMTNSGGVVEYSNFENKERIYDDSLKYNIEDIVKLNEETVTLGPEEERELAMTITMPAEEYDGVIAGGIYLSQQDDSTNEEEASGTNIKNLFGYEIAILLRNNETTVTPEVVFDGAVANQQNVRNAISLKVRNTSATYINKAHYKAELKREGSDEVIVETDQENMQFAPNTIFDLFLPMDGRRFEAGDYVLTGSITSGENEWPIEESFTITREEAEKFNEADPDVEPEDYTMVIILGVLVAIFALAAIFLIRKNKQQKAKLKALEESQNTPDSLKQITEEQSVASESTSETSNENNEVENKVDDTSSVEKSEETKADDEQKD